MDRNIYSSGRNNVGQLGDGTLSIRNVPVKISKNLGNGEIVQLVATNHNLAVTSDGELYGWYFLILYINIKRGNNSLQQLGNYTEPIASSPIIVAKANIITVATDGSKSFVLAGIYNFLINTRQMENSLFVRLPRKIGLMFVRQDIMEKIATYVQLEHIHHQDQKIVHYALQEHTL